MTSEAVPTRLVVEINEATDVDLTALVCREGLTKSTLVCRAVRAYRLLVEADEVRVNGERFRIVPPAEQVH